jgi:DNA-binding transcriptional MerR regulator
MIKIKEFSNLSGFSIRMLRYLEDVELLSPTRDTNSYRLYSEVQLEEAKFIKTLQELGLQLKEIKDLRKSDKSEQVTLLQLVLRREQEIAEVKSDTIPVLKNVIDFLKGPDSDLQDFFLESRPSSRKLPRVGPKGKFDRNVYNIPILKNIYEDHLTAEVEINLVATGLIKFGEWITEQEQAPDIFSVFNESTLIFGQNLSDDFIVAYEHAWKKLLPALGPVRLEDFELSEAAELMGPHDMMIHTHFQYLDSKSDAEIVIPYTPIYTMCELSLKV